MSNELKVGDLVIVTKRGTLPYTALILEVLKGNNHTPVTMFRIKKIVSGSQEVLYDWRCSKVPEVWNG